MRTEVWPSMPVAIAGATHINLTKGLVGPKISTSHCNLNSWAVTHPGTYYPLSTLLKTGDRCNHQRDNELLVQIMFGKDYLLWNFCQPRGPLCWHLWWKQESDSSDPRWSSSDGSRNSWSSSFLSCCWCVQKVFRIVFMFCVKHKSNLTTYTRVPKPRVRPIHLIPTVQSWGVENLSILSNYGAQVYRLGSKM